MMGGIIGFTGTRAGMSDKQKETFIRVVSELNELSEFHHGDCIGADDEAADIIADILPEEGHHIKIVCHPPIKEELRAFNKSADITLQPKDYFARNRDIVDAADILIACPKESSRQSRGGTWYTVDYAQKRGAKFLIIWPDGSVTNGE